MFSTKSKSNEKSCNRPKTMLGLVCENGIVLAINGLYHRFYYVDENIYLCFSNTLHEREALLKMISNFARDRYNKIRLDHVRDVMKKKYDRMNLEELLLAGQDSKGLHLFRFQPHSQYSSVKFIALGMRSNEINKFLRLKWHSKMNLKQGEELAREAFNLDISNPSRMEICLFFKQSLKADDDFALDVDTEKITK